VTATPVRPYVYITAMTLPSIGAIESYLDDIGAHEWHFNDDLYNWHDDVEKLIEFAGRVCYKSFGAGLNPNISKVRGDPAAYIANIIESGHGSVLEHVSVQFTLRNVSRVFTHELVRHRHGAFSQQSMRYVRLEDINYTIPTSFGSLLPPSMEDTDPDEQQEWWNGMADWFGHKMAIMSEWQEELAALWEIDKIKDFHTKKLLTSDFRRLAPHGVATDIVWTTNLRELRHVIEMRTAIGAEAEMRQVFGYIAVECQNRFPKAFADMSIDLPAIEDDPLQLNVATFKYHKV